MSFFKIISNFWLALFVYALNLLVLDAANLYSKFWWLDEVMHLLGGAVIAACFLSAVSKTRIEGSKFTIFLFTTSFVALVAVVWEFHEFFLFALNFAPTMTLTDTISDLALGIFSGSVVAFLFSKSTSY